MLEKKAFMNYECEVSDVLVFSGTESRVEDLLPAWYVMPITNGFTIDVFVWKDVCLCAQF